MDTVRQVARYSWFVVAVAALYSGYIFLSRQAASRRWEQQNRAESATAANPEFEKLYGATDVKILQFYARDGNVVEGGKTVLCYSVLNAKSVRITPPVGDTFPALNRCLEVAAERNTRYTLMAEGKDGQKVSAALELGVHSDQAELPKITSFQVAGQRRNYDGRLIYLVSFSVQNAEEIDIEPRVFDTLHKSPIGQFYVSPQRTTTYKLMVKGKRGHRAERDLTIQVPPPA